MLYIKQYHFNVCYTLSNTGLNVCYKNISNNNLNLID